MGYIVTAPACTVYLATGAVTLLYKGAELPGSSELADGEAKRLKDGGFVTSEAAAAPKKALSAAEKKAAAAAEKEAAEKAEAEAKEAAEKAAADAEAAGGSGS